MKKKMALALLLVVFLSACVSNVKTDVSNGLVISEFSVDRSAVEAGKPFRAYLDLENVGGKVAERIEAKLYGLPSEPEIKKTDFLMPPDAARNKAGGFFVTYWDLTAPELAQGLSKDYDLKARAYYDYSTSAVLTIPAYNEDEYNRMLMMNENPSSFSVTNSDAPVKVDAISDYPYIEVRKDSPADVSSYEAIPYQFVFRNIGSGIPIKAEQTGIVEGTASISGGGATFLDCFGQSGKEKIAITSIIRQGEQVPEPCTISVPNVAWSNTPKGTITITFDLSYRYYVEDSLSITVQARKI